MILADEPRVLEEVGIPCCVALGPSRSPILNMLAWFLNYDKVRNHLSGRMEDCTIGSLVESSVPEVVDWPSSSTAKLGMTDDGFGRLTMSTVSVMVPVLPYCTQCNPEHDNPKDDPADRYDSPRGIWRGATG